MALLSTCLCGLPQGDTTPPSKHAPRAISRATNVADTPGGDALLADLGAPCLAHMCHAREEVLSTGYAADRHTRSPAHVTLPGPGDLNLAAASLPAYTPIHLALLIQHTLQLQIVLRTWPGEGPQPRVLPGARGPLMETMDRRRSVLVRSPRPAQPEPEPGTEPEPMPDPGLVAKKCWRQVGLSRESRAHLCLASRPKAQRRDAHRSAGRGVLQKRRPETSRNESCVAHRGVRS